MAGTMGCVGPKRAVSGRRRRRKGGRAGRNGGGRTREVASAGMGLDDLGSVAPGFVGLGFAGVAALGGVGLYARWQYALAALVTKHVGRSLKELGPGMTGLQVGGDRRALAYYPRGVDRVVAVLGESASDSDAELTARLARENGIELRAVKTCHELSSIRDVGTAVCVESKGEAGRNLEAVAACLRPGARLVFAEKGESGDRIMEALEEAVAEGLFNAVEVDGQWLNGFPVRAALGAAVRTSLPVLGQENMAGGASPAPSGKRTERKSTGFK